MGASLFMQQRHFVDMGEAVSYSLGSGVAGCWQLLLGCYPRKNGLR
jgi:Na+-transporting NADH:ubiquinone oxidoreductase subunit NqrE